MSSFQCMEFILDYLKTLDPYERCGEIAKVLFYNEYASFKDIKKEVKNIKSAKLKDILIGLIKFNIIKCVPDESCPNMSLYKIDLERILIRFRSDIFLSRLEYTLNSSFCQIIEVFIEMGSVSIKDLILSLTNNKIICNDINVVQETLENVNELIKQGMIDMTPDFTSKWNIKTKEIRIINVDKAVEYFSSLNGIMISKISDNDEDSNCWNIEYCLNLDQINIYMRNQVILESIKFLLNDYCYIIMNKYLEIFQSIDEDLFEQPVALDDFKSHIIDMYEEITEEIFDNSIHLLTEKSDGQIQYLTKTDTVQTSPLLFNLDGVIEQLVIRDIEGLIQNCFDSPGLVLFNFVRNNNYVEEKVLLEKFSNQDKHELNDLILGMMNNGFLYKHENAKRKLYFKEKLEVFYYINMQSLIQSIQQISYKTLLNLSQQMTELYTQHKILCNKFYKIRYELNNETSADVDNQIPLITELENKEFSELSQNINKIKMAINSINCTMVLCERYLWFRKHFKNY